MMQKSLIKAKLSSKAALYREKNTRINCIHRLNSKRSRILVEDEANKSVYLVDALMK